MIVGVSMILATPVAGITVSDDEPVADRTDPQIVQGQLAQYRVSLNPGAPTFLGGPTAAEIAKLEADFPGPAWNFTVGWLNPTEPGCLAGQAPPGAYHIAQYDAGVGLPWDPVDRFEASWEAPISDFVHSNWIQFVYTSHPIEGEPDPSIDPTWWDHDNDPATARVRNFEDGDPYYWTGPEASTFTSLTPPDGKLLFRDRPARGLADAPVNWIANLYVVTTTNLKDTDGDGAIDERDVCIATRGIQWGFDIDIVGPGDPTVLGGIDRGGVAGDKFEEVLFNPPDFGILVTDVSTVKGAQVDLKPGSDPNTVNINSKGRWLTVTVELPKECPCNNIDANTILMDGTLSPVLSTRYGWARSEDSYCIDKNGNGVIERLLKFDLSDVQDFFGPGDHTVTVTGKLIDGTPFEGNDMIRVIDP